MFYFKLYGIVNWDSSVTDCTDQYNNKNVRWVHVEILQASVKAYGVVSHDDMQALMTDAFTECTNVWK